MLRLTATTLGALAILASSLEVAQAQQPDPKSCSEVHAYCMQLCGNGTPPPPPTWTCEANRCVGLAECVSTGFYKMGTQFGHRPPSRTSWGPFEKK